MSSSPIVLPNDLTSLYILKIKNPTTDPNLSTLVKTVVIDEFSKRSPNLKWTSKDKADGYIIVYIKNYSNETEIEDVKEQTLKSNVCITLRLCFYRNSDGKMIWDSQDIRSCESLTQDEDQDYIKTIQAKIIKDIIERVVLNLSNNF